MSKTVSSIGMLLIMIALIVGGVQVLHIVNIYGGPSNKWYFYSAVAIIGLVGIILAAYGYGLLRREAAKPTTQ